MTSIRLRARRLGDTRGAAAVEFALIVPLFLLLIFLLLDLGRLYYCQVSLNGAAREVARAASLRIDSSTYPTIITNAAPKLGDATQTGFSMSATAVAWGYDKNPNPTTGAATGACPTSSTVPVDQTTYVILSKSFHWMMPVGLLNIFGGNRTSMADSTIKAYASMLCT